MNFRPDIEGLRAVAILLVVAYHAGIPGFGGGYIGVDVFFVLSGYLITGLLVAEIRTTGSLNLSAFYARRARRLLPALAVMLLGTVAFSAVVYSPLEQMEYFGSAVSTATYISNIYFATAATEYGAPDSKENPLLHTWSLSVEEQFYMLWPLLVMLGLGKMADVKRLFAGMLAAAGLSFILSVYLMETSQSWAFFVSPARAWEFAIGALAVLGPVQERRRRASAAVGLAGIFLSVWLFDDRTSFPGVTALLPVLSTVLVLRAQPTALAYQLFQHLGRISYSWYLWHWPILVLGTAVLGKPSLIVRVCLLTISVIVAELSYRLVENPIRHNKMLARRPALSLAMAAALAVFGVALSLGWGHLSTAAASRGEHARISDARNDKPGVYETGCFARYQEVDVKDCAFGSVDSQKVVVLFGDSHAAQWFPALEVVAHDKEWRLIPIMKASCSEVDAPYFNKAMGRVYQECMEWRKAAFQRIPKIQPALILVSSYAEMYTFSEEERVTGASRGLKALSEASSQVIVVRDPPTPGFDAPDCLSRLKDGMRLDRASTCDFKTLSRSSTRIYELQRRVADDYPNVRMIDMNPHICPHIRCRVERDGKILYRDNNHLTATFSLSLAQVLSQEIDKALTSPATSSKPN